MWTRVRYWLVRKTWDPEFKRGYEWTMVMIGSQRLPDIHESLENLEQGGFRPRWMRPGPRGRKVKVPLLQRAHEAGVRQALLHIASNTSIDDAQARILLGKFFNPNVRPERRLT